MLVLKTTNSILWLICGLAFYLPPVFDYSWDNPAVNITNLITLRSCVSSTLYGHGKRGLLSSVGKLHRNLSLGLRDRTARVKWEGPECVPEVFMSEFQLMPGTDRGIKSHPSMPACVRTAQKGQASKTFCYCPLRPRSTLLAHHMTLVVLFWLLDCFSYLVF